MTKQPKANEARTDAISQAETEIKQIFTAVEEAASKKNLSVCLNDISPAAMAFFKEIGYSFEHFDTGLYGNYFIIRW